MNSNSGAFRITHKSMGNRALMNLQQNLSRLGDLQQKLSSGKELTRPSDSPGGSSDILRLRSEIRTTEQYARNANDGMGWLATVDQSLTGSLDLMRRVQDLTLEGMSSGAASAAGARTALAAEVSSLRDNMLQVANTRYNNRPVFGGTTTGSAAYNAAGTFVGDNNAVVRTVGDNVSVRVDANGPQVFGSGPTDVFAILQDIANDMTANPAALGGHLDRLQAATTGITDALADVGARTGRVERMRQSSDDRVLSLSSNLSSVQDIDLPATIMQLQMQESAYQAALGATQRVVQPSLVDFMK
jgi:flagellar hook-associated protein 3 FlgL